MSTFFILFFLVQINGVDLQFNKIFYTYAECQELGEILTIVYSPELVEWDCSQIEGIRF
jgi:hypothetical protein